LQRLPLDNAARYAITTLSRYALIFIGGSAAFYTIGFRWQNVQWLAAALMLGLGFGLQEIFANFFSGLIVLIERPVRVGDIVSVDNVDGVVSRIRMRATTITNWERKEMIIPNKELITGRVLNWTLSDQVQRVVLTLGVAHGSDTAKVTQTLYSVLQEHPAIMSDPAPAVTFSGIGESTLNFEVRCFLPRADLGLSTKHELHTRIDRAFREAGIQIAHPQRDLHVRTIDGAALLAQPRLSDEDESAERVARSA
jgi:potassium efflux system protein